MMVYRFLAQTSQSAVCRLTQEDVFLQSNNSSYYYIGKVMGMLFGTIIWIILTVVATYYVSKHVEERSEHCTPEGRWNNQKIAIFTVIMSGISMWMMWICCYMHQMYPIIAPKLESMEGHE